MQPSRTPLGAVFHAELLVNARRAAPYALMVVFSLNALLWWGAGPAVQRGWATNSDFFITRLLGGFTFMTAPFFIAVMMADPVIRDFELRVDPLIFSKPLTRFEYLAGKFAGNFFVLVCCQACFVLTLLALQAFSTSGMVVLPFRVAPYLKHFIFFVVLSSVLPAAICFTVGTLARSVKIVYALVAAAYVGYIAAQIAMKDLPARWRIILDPLLFNVGDTLAKSRTAAGLNALALGYDADMLMNRVLMVLLAGVSLAVLHARFSIVEHVARGRRIRLAGAHGVARSRVIPRVVTTTQGWRAVYRQLLAATNVELRLLLAERSLVVLLPVAALVSVLGLAYYRVAPSPSYSFAYASRSADSVLLFLIAMAVFYGGEALHRDRALLVEPLVWSAPVPNFVLLTSKLMTTLMLSIGTGLVVAAATMTLQAVRGQGSVDLSAYLLVYSVILLPSILFLVAAAALVTIVCRDKYVGYAACLALIGASYSLTALGHTHWSYNPLLYGSWSPADLAGGNLAPLLTKRAYCLAVTGLCVGLAHARFERAESNGGRTFTTRFGF